MAWPKWRHTLNEAKRLAVKAVDEYDCSTGHYGDFIGTMVRAWLYLLQAESSGTRSTTAIRARRQPILTEGEPKLWDVLKSAKYASWRRTELVLMNVELFIGAEKEGLEQLDLHVLKGGGAGWGADALVINLEQELVAEMCLTTH